MNNRGIGAMALISALVITALAPVATGASDRGIGANASQGAAEDTTPPRVRNHKLNDPGIGDLVDGGALRLRLRANEPCIIRTQLVFKGEVLGTSTREILAKGGRRVARLAFSRRGRAIVRRQQPRKIDVAIRATDRDGNRAQTRNWQR